ncbi:hypothetical protein AD940_01380 [Gluconobacter thailandicus]|nr:hypothetical protein AD940_01380 [Gluconobacter thailandicus]
MRGQVIIEGKALICFQDSKSHLNSHELSSGPKIRGHYLYRNTHLFRWIVDLDFGEKHPAGLGTIHAIAWSDAQKAR